jgi:hypothetical protein
MNGLAKMLFLSLLHFDELFDFSFSSRNIFIESVNRFIFDT